MFRLPTLIAVAGGLGLGVGAMSMVLSKEMKAKTSQTGFLKSAVALMDDQPTVKEVLGDSYKIGRVNLSDESFKRTALNIQVRLPIKGDKDNAFLYAYARRKKEDEKYKLFKLEMTFDNIEGKRLILLDLDDNSEGYEHPKEVEKAKDKKQLAREKLEAEMAAAFGPIANRQKPSTESTS